MDAQRREGVDGGRRLLAIDYTTTEASVPCVILPERIWFGSTDWHPEPQWLMDAWDLDKGTIRSFALCDISSIGQA